MLMSFHILEYWVVVAKYRLIQCQSMVCVVTFSFINYHVQTQRMRIFCFHFLDSISDIFCFFLDQFGFITVLLANGFNINFSWPIV